MKSVFSVLVAVSLLALAFLPASAQNCVAQYTVQRGDNLYRIGLRFGVPWPVIAQANNLANPNLIFAGQVLCIPAAVTATGPTPTTGATATRTATPRATATGGATATATATATPQATTPAGPTPTQFVVPTFDIIDVERNRSVTIRTANFPANQNFAVLMGPIGTLGLGGLQVATTNSGAGGTFTETYTIPAPLIDTNQIAIRLQSPQGYYSYNWFYNVDYP